jgi:hypothetical protein
MDDGLIPDCRLRRGPCHPEAVTDCSKSIYKLEIQGDAEPNVLALVSNLVSLANVAPRSCRMRRTQDNRVLILIELDGITNVLAHMIRRRVAGLTCIVSADLKEFRDENRSQGKVAP